MKVYFKLLRPKQWYKNFLVFTPLIFTLNLFDVNYVSLNIIGFVILCISSSGAYVINDVLDYKRDQLHSIKKNRPIASGKVSRKNAIVYAICLLVASCLVSSIFGLELLLINMALIASMLVYSSILKHIIFVDVFMIAINYIIRTIAGAIIIEAEISRYIVIGIFLLALLLAFSKRKSEISFLKNASHHRQTLKKYSKKMLNISMIIIVVLIIITYLVYTIIGPIVAEDRRLVLTAPLLIFILIYYTRFIFKYGYKGKELNDLIAHNKILAGSILLFLGMVIILLYTPFKIF